MSISITYRIT